MLLSCLFAGVEALPLKAEEALEPDEAGEVDSSPRSDKIALAEAVPALFYQLRRFPKFYGDPNTKTGGPLEQTQLLGSAGGARDFLVDHGVFIDASVLQFVQGNATGGAKDDKARFNGSADYWLTLDSGKAGLWSGGGLFLHAESSWQAENNINSDVGSLLPPNFDATMPTPGNSKGIALPELYVVQALPANLVAIVGKVDWAGTGDTNVLANNERTQFGYAGLVNNPILGAFIPYTSLGISLAWEPTPEHSVSVLGIQSVGTATGTGFGKFQGDYTVGVQYIFSPTLAGKLPGHYGILIGLDTRDVTSFAINRRHLVGEILGLVPVAQKEENYTLLLNFDQYLWVKDGGQGAERKGLPPLGIGVFGRAGWAPKDRNVIDQFYSLGIGGFGMLIPGRDGDSWGFGWAGTHISSDLRKDAGFLGVELDSFEHAAEAYYSFQVTPAVYLTVNAQVIESTAESVNTSFSGGARLRVDF